MDMKDWNDGYWTEGLDRIYTIQQMVEVLLVTTEDDLSDLSFHPAILRADMSMEANELRILLYKMYEKMGAAIPEDEF